MDPGILAKESLPKTILAKVIIAKVVNATSFVSEEFLAWCKERVITHLTGAPYHLAPNGAAERLVQTFKQALMKSSLPPRVAALEFLMQYHRMPLLSGYSLSVS